MHLACICAHLRSAPAWNLESFQLLLPYPQPCSEIPPSLLVLPQIPEMLHIRGSHDPDFRLVFLCAYRSEHQTHTALMQATGLLRARLRKWPPSAIHFFHNVPHAFFLPDKNLRKIPGQKHNVPAHPTPALFLKDVPPVPA